MKRKNKLPKFYLGTRMPTSLGYQPNYGIGGYLYTSTPGESIQPKINTIKSNTIPGALNKLLTNSSFAINALKDIIKPTAIGTTAGAINSTALNAAAVGGVGTRLMSPGAGASYMGSMGTVGGLNILGTGASTAAKEGVKQAATKSTLGTLGSVTAGIGTLYGGIDMGLLIAGNKDHRTAADMRNTLTTNTYTTDFGNTYTTHGGVNKGAELEYARRQRLAKNLNFTATSIGTGMSAGALAGSLIGSVAPGVGTAIGAGVGLLGGGLAYALGFGDTEDETRDAMNLLTNVTSMEDKMSYSLALNKDAKQGYYGRTNSGVVGAVNGKQPGKDIPRYNIGKNALVSNGEVYGEFNRDGSVKWIKRAGTGMDWNDTVPVSLGDGKKPSNNSFVFSNNPDPETGIPISEYVAQSGDVYGGLRKQEKMQNMLNNYNIDTLYRAKYGKLPKFLYGTPAQMILASVPRISGLFSNWLYANELRHADKSTPVEEINDYGANNIPYQMMSNLPDARPLLNKSESNFKNYLYRIQRNPGLGYGGRKLDEADAYAKKLDQDSKILYDNQELRRLQINEALKYRFNEALRMSNLKHDSWWRSREDRNKIISSYNNLMAQIPANRYTILSDLFGDFSSIYQYREAMKQLDLINKIYQNRATSDEISAYANLWSALNKNNQTVPNFELIFEMLNKNK